MISPASGLLSQPLRLLSRSLSGRNAPKTALHRDRAAPKILITMKTNVVFAFAGLLLLVTVPTSPGLSVDETLPEYDSLYRVEDMYSLHISLLFDKTVREVSESGVVARLEAEHYYGRFAADPLPWLTVGAGIGQSLISPVPDGSDEEASLMWMVGAEARVLQFDVTEPSFLTCRCRIDASASYWHNSGEICDQNVDWTEARAAVIGSAEFFVQGLGEDLSAVPYSIVYSVGAVFSKLDGDVDRPADAAPWAEFPVVDFGQEEHTGILAGIELKVAHNVAFEWEARVFNEVCHTLGVRYSF